MNTFVTTPCLARGAEHFGSPVYRWRRLRPLEPSQKIAGDTHHTAVEVVLADGRAIEATLVTFGPF